MLYFESLTLPTQRSHESHLCYNWPEFCRSASLVLHVSSPFQLIFYSVYVNTLYSKLILAQSSMFFDKKLPIFLLKGKGG